MQTWQTQEAKARFSELLRQTEQAGPQEITWHGHAVAVLLSSAEYQRLTGSGQSLVEFMQASPLFDDEDIDLSRDDSATREVVF